MRILVVGSGGREHALAWKLAQEAEVICAPGNVGIALDVETAPLLAADTDGLIELAKKRSIDLVVIGPEDPLVAGLADSLRDAGLATFGPGAAGALLEGSKAFSKALMNDAGVPTAGFETFTDAAAAKQFIRGQFAEGRQLAVKASGNAVGKGVVVAESAEQALEAVDRMMIHREFGSAGERVVVEERLVGREFSLLTVVGDHNFVHLPVAQDYKRVFDGDQGPNTGGMGAYSPCRWVTPELLGRVEQAMVVPILDELKKHGIAFRGTLFTGVMVTDKGPYCLEYNVRLGDPETQTIMMRLGSGFADMLMQSACGGTIERPGVSEDAVVTVVVASQGYPGPYAGGLPISLPSTSSAVKLFFAGVKENGARMMTHGGRVLAACGRASDSSEARKLAYEAAAGVRFEGAFFRTDIAAELEA